MARARSATCSVGKMDKDQANPEGNGEGEDCQRASEREVETQRAEIIGCACALINLYTLPGCEYHQSSSFLPAMHRYTLVDDTCVCFTMIGHTRADRLIESTVGVRESFFFMRILSEIGLNRTEEGARFYLLYVKATSAVSVSMWIISDNYSRTISRRIRKLRVQRCTARFQANHADLLVIARLSCS